MADIGTVARAQLDTQVEQIFKKAETVRGFPILEEGRMPQGSSLLRVGFSSSIISQPTLMNSAAQEHYLNSVEVTYDGDTVFEAYKDNGQIVLLQYAVDSPKWRLELERQAELAEMAGGLAPSSKTADGRFFDYGAF